MVQELKLADDLWPSLVSGDKTVTIRAGHRAIARGELVFEAVNSGERFPVTVVSVTHKKLGMLTDAEAQKDGAANAAEMELAMSRFYPDIDGESDITIIEYRGRAE